VGYTNSVSILEDRVMETGFLQKNEIYRHPSSTLQIQCCMQILFCTDMQDLIISKPKVTAMESVV
jgi:hypothetical protein